MNILESTSTSFILKIESLKSIINILKPQFTDDELYSIIDNKIDNLFIDETMPNDNDYNYNITTCIKIKQNKINYSII